MLNPFRSSWRLYCSSFYQSYPCLEWADFLRRDGRYVSFFEEDGRPRCSFARAWILFRLYSREETLLSRDSPALPEIADGVRTLNPSRFFPPPDWFAAPSLQSLLRQVNHSQNETFPHPCPPPRHSRGFCCILNRSFLFPSAFKPGDMFPRKGELSHRAFFRSLE